MKSVGEILKTARTGRKLTLKAVSEKTKIQSKYLKAIENNHFKSLPPAAFVKGFIQNYAKAVGANPKTALAIFRRDFAEDKKGRIIPRSFTQPIRPPSTITPKTTAIIIISLLSTLIIVFFVRQIFIFYSAPQLKLSTPQEFSTVSSPVQIIGQTDPDATISINNKNITINDSGEFNHQLKLSPGEHTIVVIVTGRNNKTRSIQQFITVED